MDFNNSVIDSAAFREALKLYMNNLNAAQYEGMSNRSSRQYWLLLQEKFGSDEVKRIKRRLRHKDIETRQLLKKISFKVYRHILRRRELKFFHFSNNVLIFFMQVASKPRRSKRSKLKMTQKTGRFFLNGFCFHDSLTILFSSLRELVDKATQTDAEQSFLKIFLSQFDWTINYAAKQLEQFVRSGIQQSTSVGRSALNAASHILDMVFGRGVHSVDQSITLFSPWLLGLRTRLTAGLRISMATAMRNLPKIVAELYLRLEAEP